MRFGRHRAPAEEAAWNDLLHLDPTQDHIPPAPAPVDLSVPAPVEERELFVRHARKDDKLVATLRAVERGSSCIVEAEVSPEGASEPVQPGPYVFSDAHQASAFVTEAVETLMYLGCDIQAA